ncbi:MAG: hypothetical protein ACOH5I_26550 [Oligoflexus sp.]
MKALSRKFISFLSAIKSSFQAFVENAQLKALEQKIAKLSAKERAAFHSRCTRKRKKHPHLSEYQVKQSALKPEHYTSLNYIKTWSPQWFMAFLVCISLSVYFASKAGELVDFGKIEFEFLPFPIHVSIIVFLLLEMLSIAFIQRKSYVTGSIFGVAVVASIVALPASQLAGVVRASKITAVERGKPSALVPDKPQNNSFEIEKQITRLEQREIALKKQINEDRKSLGIARVSSNQSEMARLEATIATREEQVKKIGEQITNLMAGQANQLSNRESLVAMDQQRKLAAQSVLAGESLGKKVLGVEERKLLILLGGLLRLLFYLGALKCYTLTFKTS